MTIPGYIQTEVTGDYYAVMVETDNMELLAIHDTRLSADTLSSALVGLEHYRGFVGEWLTVYHSAILTLLTDDGIQRFQ